MKSIQTLITFFLLTIFFTSCKESNPKQTKIDDQSMKAVTKSFENPNIIKFTDKDFGNKTKNRLENFINQNGSDSPKIKNHIKLINGYHFIQTYRNKQIYKSNELIFDMWRDPQFLNDELIILEDGKLFNLLKDDFEKIQISRNSENQTIMIDKFSDFYIDNSPLKSDIITSYGYINNILKGKGFLANKNDFDLKIYNNQFSKYISTGSMLINKFNSQETIKYDLIDNIEEDVFTYTDSTYIIPVKLFHTRDFKLLNYEYNSPLNIDRKNIFFNDKGSPLRWSEAGKVMDKYNYGLGEMYYYFKKYNKVDLKEKYVKGVSDFQNELKTYENLFEKVGDQANPVLVLEYNFITRKLKSVLDRSIFPFTNIDKLFIDNQNRFLFIQDGILISLFDLITKKEVVTFYGVMDSIDENNFLHLNLFAEYSDTSEQTVSKVFYDIIDINDLYKSSTLNYFKELDNFGIDEFMTKQEFYKKYRDEFNKQLSNFENNSFLDKKSISTSKITLLESNSIIDKITKNINQYVETINNNLRSDSLKLDLSYEEYSFDEKEVRLKFNSKSLKYIEPFISREPTDYVRNVSFEFEGKPMKLSGEWLGCWYNGYNPSACSISISGVEPELARSMKNGDLNFSIILTSSTDYNSTIPSYNSTFILQNRNLNRYFRETSKSLLKYKFNVVNLSLGNTIKPIRTMNIIDLNNKKLELDNEYTITIIE